MRVNYTFLLGLASAVRSLPKRLAAAFRGMARRLAGGHPALRESLANAERLGAEARERGSRLRRPLDTAPDGIVTLDAAGRVVDLNAAAERLLGTEGAVLRGRGLDACVDLELLTPAARSLLLGAAATPETPCRGELDLLCVGGQRVPVELTASAWRSPAGAFRTLFLRDVSERRRAQVLLEERAQRADVANQAKTRFLAAMSHEIRTPLNAILNMNELLLESELDEEQRSYAATAGESARALLSIVNSVLDFSKIESGRMEPAPRASDPEEIVKSAVDLLAARAHARGLELGVLCEPTVPERFETDPGLVRQILLNLVGNAIRFTDEGVVQLRLSRDPDAELLRIAVEDTGVGIAEADQTELFTEFKQAQGPGGRPEGGSGLGLAISRRLARLLGGDITLASAPGEGSCFTLVLPLPASVPDGARQAAAAPLKDCLVGLWSDNALLTDVLAKQLRAFGVSVSVLRAPAAAAPGGRCGAVRLSCGGDPSGAAETTREIALYRVGSRCPVVAGAPWVASLRIPVTPSVLAAALGEALHKETPSLAQSPADDIAERVARHAANALPVLLAEDSRANQLVATSILAKAGFRVDVAENGLQAVAAVSRQNYSLVLMDLAMPEMDGIEATGCIRALPGKRGRVPIIAMTANAFDEDRRRCLEAGMDGYLSKPIERRVLFEALLQWARAGIGGTVAAAPTGTPTAAPEAPAAAPIARATASPAGAPPLPRAAVARVDTAEPPVLDERVIAALVTDLSEALMPEVVATFVDEARERIAAIVQAAAAGKCARAGDHGHALKGSAATFGAVALRDLALAIEQSGRGGDLGALRRHVAGLRSCGETVLRELQARYGGEEAD